MRTETAQAWFFAGTLVLIFSGSLHVVYALYDVVRPRFFAPIDRSVTQEVESTGIRLVGESSPSMWSVWIGIHISHGLGVASFGLVCLLVGAYDFELVRSIDALLPLTVAFSAAYLVLSLRFWFRAPVIITGTATACFTLATVLSA